ncbi:hypothetical protein IDAT_07715 [Pseudidiomarina atlantica]|uniref:Riboflavin biosynthesis protein RibD n=1 Tax=Pseudidiomarina atlantica TaxID=1517416 RepID=A0A094L1X3_9GAMM|nr:bifunctional diaminohydroxyphosphoribosylaminopyrimidine deaminase/5-amino-6-(5-phosphoribosylamino)uracil reductase RibD [Pseudidiomarina atlantica]KFZ28628.1 hypothetical protein IDAT_07715 [Pseudidiomarina atlantica]
MTDAAQAHLDNHFMQMALTLAERGRFTAAPNPCVGCVIVAQQEVVGSGYHERPGEPHAEVFALREAGARAHGATAYVTLEPCSHFGRTPPCADGLIKAKVSRVVVALQDPNPLVAGQGIERLRAAGIQVDVGVLETAARQLNLGFISRMERQLPWVRLKMAMSLDGRTALSNGRSQWITGEQARLDVHRYRACSGAVLTSARTVLMDQARMTARHPEAQQQPLRVLLDRRAEVAVDHPFFAISTPVLRVVDATVEDRAHWPAHVQTLRVPSAQQRLPLQSVLAELAQQQINEVWTECGAELAGALVSADLVDEYVIYMAPKLLGDSSRGLLQLPEFSQLEHVPQLHFQSFTRLGEDIRINALPLHRSVMARGEVTS